MQSRENFEAKLHRTLRPGDRITAHTVIESISEQKTTALGIGFFVVTRTRMSDQQGEEAGARSFRVLKFRPKQPCEDATESTGSASSSR